MEQGRAFQPACILVAAAELGLFAALADGRAVTPEELAARLGLDARALTTLLNALVALGLLLRLPDGTVQLLDSVRTALGEETPDSVLAGLRHLGTCLRRWAELADVVRTGQPVHGPVGTDGRSGELASFIAAMEVFCRPSLQPTLDRLNGVTCRHLLDVGGAAGHWTAAFLERRPEATACLFDRPEVIEMARARLGRRGLLDRVQLVAGDYLRDDLPAGADLVWLSAVTHQHSRAENRGLYGRIARALAPEGALVIRDVIMEPDGVHPASGALFAVNMLVATPGGATYDYAAYVEDLTEAGFGHVERLWTDPSMDSLILARL